MTPTKLCLTIGGVIVLGMLHMAMGVMSRDFFKRFDSPLMGWGTIAWLVAMDTFLVGLFFALKGAGQ